MTKDDTATIEAAISAGEALEPQLYRFARPLRLESGQMLCGCGMDTIIAPTDDFPEGQPLLDLTGASKCTVADLAIHTAGKARPGAGILLARSSPDSAAHHVFRGVEVKGEFRLAGVVNIGSELDEWHGCRILVGGEAPAPCYYTGGHWTPGVRKLLRPRLPVWPPPSSRFRLAKYAADGVHNFYGGWLGSYGRKRSPNIVLTPGAHTLNLYGTYFSNKDGKEEALAAILASAGNRDDDWRASVTASGCYFECNNCSFAVAGVNMLVDFKMTACRISTKLGLVNWNVLMVG